MIFDIETLHVNDNLVKLDNGYLHLNDNQTIRLWEIEVYGTNSSALFKTIIDKRSNTKLKIGIKDEKVFLGMAIVTKLIIVPSGNMVHLKGTCGLEEVN